MAAGGAQDDIRTLIATGRLDDAADACRRLIEAGDDPEARYLLAVVMGQKGLFSESIQLFETASREFPDRAEVAYNFGTILHTAGKVEDAIGQWSRAAEIDPSHADAHFNLGRAYSDRAMWEDALIHFEAAATLRPKDVRALFNLGNVNFRLGRMGNAKYCLREAVVLDEEFVDGWINLGLAALRGGTPDEAVIALERAVALDPGNLLAHFNLGQALLADGRMAEGFAEVEWRRRVQNLPFAVTGQPAWTGDDTTGKRILLYAEQGLGDTIHFLRYAKSVAEAGAAWVGVCCHPGLMEIAAAAAGVDAAFTFDDPPPAFDTFAPLMSLPHLLRLTGIDQIPPAPYITPPRPAALDGNGLRVGLVWAGNPDQDDDVNRSARLAELAPLVDVAGTAWFSLQVGSAAMELEAGGFGRRITDLGSGFQSFADTAAAMQALDLVISVDSAPAHFAGAIGRPVWMLLPRVTDWRWCQPGDETPLYGSMRLFRQTGDGGWPAVAERVASALADKAKEKTG